jgi:hypothetical protein
MVETVGTILRQTRVESLRSALIYSLALFMAVLSVSSCIRRAPGAVDPRADATVRVENRGLADMTIYIVNQTQRIRLGMAPGLNTTTLRIPPDLVRGGTVRFLADPVGSARAPVSEEISVFPGDELVLVIPPR